jgi:tetratricopeptide (TPR) repeat protein
MQRLFQERHTTAIDSLENYLDTYKYAPYVDEIELMRAVLLVEKDKFKPALKILEEINPKNLFRESEDMFYFYKGYTLLNLEKHEEALKVLKPLKTKQNPYFLQATYYIGYCYFKMGNMYFPQALSEFLSLEGKGYSKMVPYHILQIHYVSGEYDKVYKLAEELLRKYPDNDYNYEIHRIVGEIYYQNGIYNDAIRHLKAYQELTQKKPARRKEIQYNDLYLLGISCYKEQQFKD